MANELVISKFVSSNYTGDPRLWRRSGTPEFKYTPLEIDLSGVPEENRPSVTERCFASYKQANGIFDQSIADAALECVEAKPSPLLEMSQLLSQRYLDLYEIQVAYEMTKGIPMIPVDAGQLKNHGFTSREILRMQKCCQKLVPRILELQGNLAKEEFAEFIRMLTDPELRKGYIGKNFEEHKLILAYEKLDEKELIDRACFMMFRFGHYSVKGVLHQLNDIAQMVPEPKASFDQRLLMEIRHRVAGDGSECNRSPGSLGTNPIAYLNLIRKGEAGHPVGEFRGRMYFVYMNNHFANACMQDDDFLRFANTQLEKTGKNWRMDPEFVAAMNEREPKFLPPVFRYGANAALNGMLREYMWNPLFYAEHPNPLLKDVMNGSCDMNVSFRHPLSSRELIGQIGHREIRSIPDYQPIKMWSGGSIFRIREPEEMPDSEIGRMGKKYLEMNRKLRLPAMTSISGTMDQMATMSRLVGFGAKQIELHMLQTALIGFMVPARDHSVHEILQSATTFGLEYVAGPGFEQYIYPEEPRFVEQIYAQQLKRGVEVPSYYLSAAYASEIYQREVHK